MSSQAISSPTAATEKTNSSASTKNAQANETKNTKTYKEFTPTVNTKQELVDQLINFSDDRDLWQLTYLLHSRETFRLVAPDNDERISFRFNEFCSAGVSKCRLENITRSLMKGISNADWHEKGWSVSKNSLGQPTVGADCSLCQDEIAFCPHKMNAYLQHVCNKLGVDPDEIYQDILKESFVQKVNLFEEVSISEIPAEKIEFVDPVSAAAAAELIKLRIVKLSASGEDRLNYTYLPLCEKTKQTFIHSALDFHKFSNGRTDFLYSNDFKEAISQNRNCPNCIYTQCPDKVAAYILNLAARYSVNPVKLAMHIVKVNRQGMSAQGAFVFCEKMRDLDEIPLTPESRKTIHNIAKYVINRWYGSDKKIPFIPFNLAIFTRDELLADKTVLIIKNFLFFYNYWNKTPTIEEYRFSHSGLNGLIDAVARISEPTILHVKEMELLAAVSANNPGDNIQLKMMKLTNLVKEKNDKVFIFVSGEKNKLDSALSLYKEFYSGLLSSKVTISDMSTMKIVQSIITTLKDKFELEENFEEALESYVLAKYGESDLKSQAFIDLITQTIIFNHFNREINVENKLLIRDIPAMANRRSRDDIWLELNGLAGLENVKAEIRNIEQLLSFRKKTADLGLKHIQRLNMHMVFAGNPGTGKTTVARLIAEMLYNIGYIKQNKLIEVSPKDLIGQYIGHTAPKTAAICEAAYDGVLFIDEAYELTVNASSSNTNQFRSECITELIKQMEDNRDRLIVIFAGYTAEMRRFLESNAGFASRIGKFIEFEDYTTEQLTAMFIRQAYNNGMRVSEKALQRVQRNIEEARLQPHFGNGRYSRNLFEKVLLEHAKNTFDVNEVDLLTVIAEEDVPANL